MAELSRSPESPRFLWDWLHDVGLPDYVLDDLVLEPGIGKEASKDVSADGTTTVVYIEDNAREFSWHSARHIVTLLTEAGVYSSEVMLLLDRLPRDFPELTTKEITDVTRPASVSEDPETQALFTLLGVRDIQKRLSTGLTEEALVELCWYYGAYGQLCAENGRFEDGLRAFPADFSEYLTDYREVGTPMSKGWIYDETAVAAMVYSRLLGYFDGVEASPASRVGVASRQAQFELLLSVRESQARIEQHMETQGVDQKAMTDLLLEAISNLDAASGNAEQFRLLCDNVVRRWEATATERDKAQLDSECSALCGAAAWDALQPDSQTDLRVYRIFKRDWRPDYTAPAGRQLYVTFERELKKALTSAGVRHLPQTLERLLDDAADHGGHLRDIADGARKARITGWSGGRNRASHGDSYSDADLKVAEGFLLDHDGRHGAIGMLAAFSPTSEPS